MKIISHIIHTLGFSWHQLPSYENMNIISSLLFSFTVTHTLVHSTKNSNGVMINWLVESIKTAADCFRLNLEVTGTKNTQKKSNPDSPGRKKVRLEQKPFLWKHAKDLTTSYPNRICNELSSFFYLHIGLEIIFTLKKVFIYTIAFYEQTTQMWHCIITIFFWQSFFLNTYVNTATFEV